MNKKICIIGLGYVGLPLAVAFSKKFKVIGFDISLTKINDLKNSKDISLQVGEDLLNSVKKNITYTSNIQDAKDCNIYIVAVPTPVDKVNRPIFTPLIKSSKIIGSVLSKNDIVIFEVPLLLSNLSFISLKLSINPSLNISLSNINSDT